MGKLPEFTSVKDIRYGHTPSLDAWLLHFMTENNLDYAIDPQKNASPEQVSFMVPLEENQVFAPCSERVLRLLLSARLDPELKAEYNTKWRALSYLVHNYVSDPYLRKRILGLCRYKHRLVRASSIIIPSRLMKRYITIFLTQSGLVDPFRGLKRRFNAQALAAIESGMLDALLDFCPDESMGCSRLSDLRFDLDMLEMERLLVLSTTSGIWEETRPKPVFEELKRNEFGSRANLERLNQVFMSGREKPMKILYLPDTSGGLMFDLLLVRALLRQGHRVVLALKEGFYFGTPTFWDWEGDPALTKFLEGARFLPEDKISKNELLKAQRENPFLVISDGTREELNLYRASVTFARAWKESDLILAKGDPHHRRLIQTGRSFTRDILCFYRDRQNQFNLDFKSKPESVKKFSEQGLLAKADEIIKAKRQAKAEGKSVMFYSAIIGSLPEQTGTAIQVMDVFVRYLRTRLEKTFIINPAEHFEEGMDADDLMFMWEKVQRSGLIDVWRFQTVEDIEKSFELMGSKIPPIWTGKDSTFSTGCTKEMRIALDMQARFPEMQIIGPNPEKFFRRLEYGVGKFSDVVFD